MKRSLFGAVALATTLAVPSMAHAQMASPIKFGISAGLTVPVGTLKDKVTDADNSGLGLSSGYNVNGHLGFQPPLLPLGLRVDIGYNKMSNSDIKLDYTNLNGSLNAIFNLGMAPVVSPYIIGGVGMYNQKLKANGVDESKTSFGLNGGLGLRFGLSGFSTFAEARYHYVMSDGDKNGVQWKNASFIPVSFGIMF